jgi:hypothetical protein
MQKTELDDIGGVGQSAEDINIPNTELIKASEDDRSDLIATVATVAVVGIGAAVFEAALLPGVVLGVAAMCVPRFLPQIAGALNPVFRSTVRGAYTIGQKAHEMGAEAQEQVYDIIAEVDAELNISATTSNSVGQ